MLYHSSADIQYSSTNSTTRDTAEFISVLDHRNLFSTFRRSVRQKAFSFCACSTLTPTLKQPVCFNQTININIGTSTIKENVHRANPSPWSY